MSEIKLGADIDCMCSKCKMELGHVITAIVDDKIKKVRCNTCGYEHAYATKKKAASSTTAKKHVAKEKEPAITEAVTSMPVTSAQYEHLIGSRDLSEAKPYSFSAKFAEGELIKHDTFGTGIVTSVKVDHKITVMFPDRLRLLVHDRTAI